MDKSAVKNEFSQKIGRLAQSGAFLDFCQEVYGYRSCLFNMMDKEQFDYVLNAIPVMAGDTVLDLGCGTGGILKRIVAKYGCAGVGIDLLPDGVGAHRGQMQYLCGDIDEISKYRVQPTITLSIDSLYFSSNLDRLIRELASIENNRLYFFYSQYLFDETTDKSILQARQTSLAQALCKAGAAFQTLDFSENERLLYLNMKRALEKREGAFAAEKNADLYEQKLQEVRLGMELFESRRAARYLYISQTS